MKFGISLFGEVHTQITYREEALRNGQEAGR
jgi:hypothetical protein